MVPPPDGAAAEDDAAGAAGAPPAAPVSCAKTGTAMAPAKTAAVITERTRFSSGSSWVWAAHQRTALFQRSVKRTLCHEKNEHYARVLSGGPSLITAIRRLSIPFEQKLSSHDGVRLAIVSRLSDGRSYGFRFASARSSP